MKNNYALKLLSKYGILKCSTATTPMEEGTRIQQNMSEPFVDTGHYQSLVGSLIFSTNTRPDISFSVYCVSRSMSCPQTTHFEAARRILRYVSGTVDHCIFFPGRICISNCRSSWTPIGPEILTKEKSTMGMVFKLGSSTIQWSGKLQPTIAVSPIGAESKALPDGAQ